MTEEKFQQQEEYRKVTEARKNSQLLTESEIVGSQIYSLIKPLYEARRQQQIREQELQTSLVTLLQKFTDFTEALKQINEQLNAVTQLKSANASLEAEVLRKLNNLL